jgi:hypothetical protein
MRQYEKLWKQLKKQGKVSCKFKVARLKDVEAESKIFLRKLSKAVGKEKNLDLEFKRKFPNSRLQFSLDLKSYKISIKLTNYIIISREF